MPLFKPSRRSSSTGAAQKADTKSGSSSAPTKGNSSKSKPQTSGDGILEAGARVVIGGLNGAKELNGKVAVVFSYDASTGRYVIELEDGGGVGQKKVKAENLTSKGNSTGVVAARARAAAAASAQAAGAGTAATRASNAPRPRSTSRAAGTPSTSSPRQQSTGIKFSAGTQVSLFGLSKAPELNGKSAVVQRFDKATERYIVKLQSNGCEKSLRPENLKAVEADKASRDRKFDAIDADLHDQLDMGDEAEGAMTRLSFLPTAPGLG